MRRLWVFQLLNTDYPSWLYQVKLGATTMWERWDGWTPETGFSDVGMNSFNHYAFGSVGDYLFSIVGGISENTSADGTHLQLAPVPGPGLDFARAAYRSQGGEVKSEWKRIPGGIEYQFTIPPNQVAQINLGTAGQTVREIGNSKNSYPDFKKPLGSGTYRFFVPDQSK